MEDLWAFNEEIVARAIYDSEIPVISAVGHEPDVTIADFVADLRAATPSNAAELAVPDQNDMYARMEQLGVRMKNAIERKLSQHRTVLARMAASRAMTTPKNYLQDRRMLVDYQQHRLINGLNGSLAQSQRRVAALAASLDALSPLKVLGRGYSIARTEDGTVLSSVKQAVPDTRFRLRLSDGDVPCRVEREEMKHG